MIREFLDSCELGIVDADEPCAHRASRAVHDNDIPLGGTEVRKAMAEVPELSSNRTRVKICPTFLGQRQAQAQTNWFNDSVHFCPE